MVDYAKWDSMNFSDSDDEGNTNRRGKPRVTVLPGKSRVVVGPDASLNIHPEPTCTTQDLNLPRTKALAGPSAPAPAAASKSSLGYDKWDNIGLDAELLEEDEAEAERLRIRAEEDEEMNDEYKKRVEAEAAAGKAKAEAAKQAKAAQAQAAQAGAAKAGAAGQSALEKATTKFTTNGGKGSLQSAAGKEVGYMWSQTKKGVEVYMQVPAAVRCQELALRVQNPNGARDFSVVELLVKGDTVAREELAYPVDDVEDEEDVEWQMLDWDQEGGVRVVQVVLVKKEVGMGVTVWWKRFFKGGPEIDVALIQGRNLKNQSGMKEVWESAQAMFLKKVAEREPIYIDTD